MDIRRRYARHASLLLTLVLVWGCSGDDNPVTPEGDIPPPVADTQALSGTWRRVADLPLPSRAFAATAYRGAIYVVGGLQEAPDDMLRQAVMRYHPAEDRWEILNDLPWFAIEAGLFVVSDTMFVVGGRLETVGRYDPATDSWEARPSLPQPRDEAAMGAGEGAIYVVGGNTDSQGAPPANEAVLIYDVSAGTWTYTAGPSAALRRSAAAAVLTDRLFVIGGFPMASTGSAIPNPTPAVPVLDLPSQSWSAVPDLPFGRWGLSAAAVNGRVHVIGGSVLDDDPARSTHVAFDPGAGEWLEAPDIPTPRRNARAVALDGALYVLGGSERPPEISDGLYRGTVVEVFTPN